MASLFREAGLAGAIWLLFARQPQANGISGLFLLFLLIWSAVTFWRTGLPTFASQSADDAFRAKAFCCSRSSTFHHDIGMTVGARHGRLCILASSVVAVLLALP